MGFPLMHLSDIRCRLVSVTNENTQDDNVPDALTIQNEREVDESCGGRSREGA